MHIVVGSVVKKDNKYLLVQESKEQVFGFLYKNPKNKSLDCGIYLQGTSMSAKLCRLVLFAKGKKRRIATSS